MIQISSSKFRAFVAQMTRLAPGLPEHGMDEAVAALRTLVAKDDWLPECYRKSGTDQYRQYLLAMPDDRAFSIVSFVWGPGQGTPVHDHGVWGLVGVLVGAELEQRYAYGKDGPEPIGGESPLTAGMVSAIVPGADIHRVRNALADRVSISIHVYGGDIGTRQRRAFGADGSVRSFVSGYSAVDAS